MTDAEEAMRLTNHQKFYMKTALCRLAEKYESQKETEHATQVRMLAERVDSHNVERTQPTAQDASPWQKRLVECGQDHQKVQGVLLEWWNQLCLTAPDPSLALVQALMPMMEQTGKQMALQILMTLEQKMRALAADPAIPSPEVVLGEVLRFIQQGQAQVQGGKPLWADDKHLLALAQHLRQQAEQTPQAQSPPPQPPT